MIPMHLLLLTQMPGRLNENNQPLPESMTSNRSCALFVAAQNAMGHVVTQFEISDCRIENDTFYYQNVPIDITVFDGVIKRTWDGGENSQKGLQLLQFLERFGLTADNPSAAIAITMDKMLMQRIIDSVEDAGPETVYIDDCKDVDEVVDNFFQTDFKHQDYQKPAVVLKPQYGTHGQGIKFFLQDERDKAKSDIKNSLKANNPCLLQRYIKPK